MEVRGLLALSAAAVAFSAQPSRANPCSQNIDRAWVQVNATIQTRIAAGRLPASKHDSLSPPPADAEFNRNG
jgi:hypothetical protein